MGLHIHSIISVHNRFELVPIAIAKPERFQMGIQQVSNMANLPHACRADKSGKNFDQILEFSKSIWIF